MTLFLHFVPKLPTDLTAEFDAVVNTEKRIYTESNHSATHLLHEALRTALGNHVEQRGSLVHPNYLRFDFSHFQKLTDDEIVTVEKLVNLRIRENIALEEQRDLPLNEAKALGAMSLFGEKYGETVRVIRFGTSIELCGGTHVKSTGQISLFKITSESSTAAGIRRIEAVTGAKALEYVNEKIEELETIAEIVKNKKALTGVQHLVKENIKLKSDVQQLTAGQASQIKTDLLNKVEEKNGVRIIAAVVDIDSGDAIKDLAFQLKKEVDNLLLILGSAINGKAHLTLVIDEKLVKDKGWDAAVLIREFAKEIQGGGGGQPFYATAGGKDVNGISKAIQKARDLVGVG